MKKVIKVLAIVLTIIIALSLVGLFAFLSFDRAGGEQEFDAVVLSVEDNVITAEVTYDNASFFSAKLPDKIVFDSNDSGETGLQVGDKIHGNYLKGTIDGNNVRVVSLVVLDQNAVAPNKCLDEVAGNITFYEEPVKEAQNSGGTVTVRLSRDLNEEQADKLKDIIDDVDEWTDDHSVDRLAYYFDGAFELSDREHSYYFTYEYNVIYYDHYFAEIPAEDMQYIKDLGTECLELPDIETNSISFDDLAPGTETTFDTKIDVLTNNSELAYTLTYSRAAITLEIGLRSEDGTELTTEITGGDAKGVISNVPAGTYTVFLRNIEEVNKEATESPNVTGALHFCIRVPNIERTEEPDEYPDTNIIPGYDLDEPNEPTT